ncbi:MAG: tRNA lysidine(34) synthetase TilS [Prevotella sp.]|nr:tRNA lysidine(34) synthetase TilS [Prevotella sp.]
MKQKVSEYIRKRGLLKPEGHYLVALSGGADSVCLLLLLKQLGYSVEAIHCNFHLRGEESDRDESFCRQLCDEQQIKLHLVHFDTQAYAQLHKVSIEMAARQLRYRHFAQLCYDAEFQGICVAHHQDDVVETVLMNLIRGTGIKGLSGIKPLQSMSFQFNGQDDSTFQLPIIRPMLCVSRDEITDYLNQMRQTYVTDSTNLIPDVQRNKIRLQVLPLLREINPSVSRNIVETAENLAFADEYLDERVEQDICGMFDEITLMAVPNTLSIPVSRVNSEYLLYRMLNPYGFTSAQIKQIYSRLDAPTGTEYYSDTHILVFDRGRLLIEETGKKPFREMRIPEEGIYMISDGAKIKIERLPLEEGFQIPSASDVIVVDADKLQMPLVVRLTKEGDRFVPFGMKGSKLVSDFLTDQKLSLLEKRRQLVIADSTDKILWIVSRRPDNRFRITDTTRTILRISFIKSK